MIFCTVERVTFVVEVSLISVRRNMKSSCKVEGGCKFWSNGNEKIVKNVGYASLVNYFSTILFQHYFDLCHLVRIRKVFSKVYASHACNRGFFFTVILLIHVVDIYTFLGKLNSQSASSLDRDALFSR